ncbi:DUF4158 domain-containing protein [Dactylosporangium sp. CA-233914]|uniref:DUF4158 domain-containing protein n=1 Tax=Dactylosporangium sp. CA-233914 TaxID=3239934 RepID=UPI003D9041F7
MRKSTLTRPDLEGFSLLDGTALDLIANKRGDHNRLGVAVQIDTVRYLGHCLTEVTPGSASRCSRIGRPSPPNLRSWIAADLARRMPLAGSGEIPLGFGTFNSFLPKLF